jgi:hypothetical protein
MDSLMRLETILILLILPVVLKGQLFVNENNRWHNANCCFDFGSGQVVCDVEAYKLVDGYDIAGTSYHQLIRSEDESFGDFDLTGQYYREESGKVYFRSENDTEEFMIYDFTLSEADTFLLVNDLVEYKFEVVEVDSVQFISGEYRKGLKVREVDSGLEEYILEGVGGLHSPMSPIDLFLLDCWKEHRCFYSVDTLEFESGLGICDLGFVESKRVPGHGLISLFPSPFSDVLYFNSQNVGMEYEVEIFDLQGNLLMQSSLKSGEYIDVGTAIFRRGMYIAWISQNGSLIKLEKIIKV